MVDTHMIDVCALYEQYVTLAGKPSRVWRTGDPTQSHRRRERELDSICETRYTAMAEP